MALKNIQLSNPTSVTFGTTTGWNMAADGTGPATWTSIDVGDTGAYDSHEITGLGIEHQMFISGSVKKAMTITLEGYAFKDMPEDPVIASQTLTIGYATSPGFTTGGSRAYTVIANNGIRRGPIGVNGLTPVTLELHAALGTATRTASS